MQKRTKEFGLDIKDSFKDTIDFFNYFSKLYLPLNHIIERIYNSRDEFQVTAKDASYYGILEAKLTTREKLHDFDYLYDTLEENYPFFKVNERLFGIDWL